MNKSLHSRLVKRGLDPDGTKLSGDYTIEKLKEIMATKRKFPVSNQDNMVENILIFENMASASLNTGYPNLKWVEYIHLMKLNNEWKIINVFWEFEN